MKRVLVPLDGSNLAESILPDALRLAGPDGEILLVRDAPGPVLGESGDQIPAHAARLIEQPTITVRSKEPAGSPS